MVQTESIADPHGPLTTTAVRYSLEPGQLVSTNQVTDSSQERTFTGA